MWTWYTFGQKENNKQWEIRLASKTEMQMLKENHETATNECVKILILFYFSLCSQALWFTHRWHHGDHSYFYWMVNGQLFSMLCHLSNPHQSTSPWEKKVKHPKMIESWKVEYDTHMPCYCPRHVSQVKCLVTATGLLSLFVCYSLQHLVCPLIQQAHFAFCSLFPQIFRITQHAFPCEFWTKYFLSDEALWSMLRYATLPPTASLLQGFDVCVWLQGWGYSWPCVVCSKVQSSHMPSD